MPLLQALLGIPLFFRVRRDLACESAFTFVEDGKRHIRPILYLPGILDACRFSANWTWMAMDISPESNSNKHSNAWVTRSPMPKLTGSSSKLTRTRTARSISTVSGTGPSTLALSKPWLRFRIRCHDVPAESVIQQRISARHYI